MSDKPPDPYAAVRDVIRRLSSLTHDELRDLADMLRADAAPDVFHIPPRHGLPPLDPEGGHELILYGGWQYRDKPPLKTAPARQELHDAYEVAGELPPEASALVGDVARMLQRALAPVAERLLSADGEPIAEGSIEAKTIPRKIYDPDTGEYLETREFGPYLYYRFWVSGGDADRTKKRLKNKYIGKQNLAARYDATLPGSEERRELERRIIAAFKSDTLDTLMRDMGIDPDPRPPQVLGNSNESPNTPPIEPDATTDTPETPGRGMPEATPLFLPDYQTAPTRKQVPLHFELSDERRDVLATIAAGLNYSPDHQAGIQGRKVARRLADAGLLSEVTGETNHRKHRWRLTDAGLKLIRHDANLQRQISRRMD